MRHHIATLALRLSIVTVMGVVVLGPSGAVSAGGWAVASLDSLPTATAGEAAQIGFTILQHGVSPAELTDGVGVDIVHEDGTVESFPAHGDGVAGHYVATVTFPVGTGAYQWSIRMGWLGEHDLGTLTVGGETDATSSSGWQGARRVTLAATAALGATMLVDLAFAPAPSALGGGVTRIGRWCAIGAVLMGAITVATWNVDAGPSVADGAPEGRQLFRAKGCSGCHAGPESSPDLMTGFPSLADAPAWAGTRLEGMTAEEYLRESIASPGAFISPAFRPGGGPTTGMPQLRLAAVEIDALVEFLLHR